jgi:HEAT repeat protein
MQRLKSKPEDERKIYDEGIDAVERSSAIARLRFDGYEGMESLLVKLLKHPSFLLRRDAVVTLVGFWRKSEHLNAAVHLLHKDRDETVRSGAAFALGEFVAPSGQQKTFVASELTKALKNESQPNVQEAIYKALLKFLEPTRQFPAAQTAFKPERDVNWNLLEPYLP